MEANFKKRKKLKTRKFRDKLRENCKLSKLNNTNENNSYMSVNLASRPIGDNNKLSSHSLTLKAFPHVVRTETIKRPSLRAIKHKKYIHQLSKKINPKSVDHSISKLSNSKDDSILSVKNTMPVKGSPPEEVLLFSPLPNKDGESSSSGRKVLPLPTASEFNQNTLMHNDLMAEISSNTQKLLPNLRNEDVMLKNKKRLKELYWQKLDEVENNVKCLSHVISTPYSLKPKDLVKSSSAHLVRQIQGDNYLNICSESCSSSPLLTCTPADSPCSPLESFKLTSKIYDTPEYKYYPHKLK